MKFVFHNVHPAEMIAALGFAREPGVARYEIFQVAAPAAALDIDYPIFPVDLPIF
ncbi:MAG: hypothetical protein HC880_16450 [Bacteroidia bacterium]|nr:hypothetical protein [Bacteroidia bacterium]